MKNEKTVNVKISRGQLIDLILLCDVHMDDAKKWGKLSQKLYEQLEAYDAKHLDDIA